MNKILIMITDFIKKPIFIWINKEEITRGTNNYQVYTFEYEKK